MTKNVKSVLIALLLITTVFTPFFSLAQDGLVPCGTEKYGKGEVVDGQNVEYQIKNPCGFNHIFELISKVINFLLVVIALPIAAIMFAYAGFLFMFSGVQPEQRSKAKKIFGNVALGFILALAAWLIIHTILTLLGYTSSWLIF
ncbi:hypothetical protein A2914_02290 [Candidatus Nomurabacteria bacterium RIFCSPLOWO2_01_FULL_41_21]|uniref:DUF4190 domain-containing protein n=2 Tax=Candidatus Nomuraibacteriota TaxID=1752729 RepID=A0A1F6V3A3_9BACT|nr:MAG: hypothetical protein A2733_01680 [Candidatus Nomurabacteria bacterium RIFCSPHIGHO2_01_FULL_40_20]OGI88755.1 MAG: hypothetical protein A2914_02290 [Candidatus Nomurabacteria bacterium RIFCSPLOWO2_01_FULL_41_21]